LHTTPSPPHHVHSEYGHAFPVPFFKAMESTPPFQAHRHVHRHLPVVSYEQHDYEHTSYISQKCTVDGVVHRCELCETDLLTVDAMKAHCREMAHREFVRQVYAMQNNGPTKRVAVLQHQMDTDWRYKASCIGSFCGTKAFVQVSLMVAVVVKSLQCSLKRKP
jgi:hypothetical protein